MVDAAIEQSMMELSECDVRRYDIHINVSSRDLIGVEGDINLLYTCMLVD
jgi:hypothetical protein